ncbi:hypothetical protein [Aquisalimonas sp.]|uniref:hypothetical protein n=1 Tax=Aquisalimonas sp. TaxID=1872621 RepID=UPI0025C121F0|nr:hypothetical protein [Aquisalimonas sp.]
MTLNVTAIIVALIGASAGVLAYLQAQAARREERRATAIERESDALDRARAVDDAIVARLEDELERLARLLDDSREENVALRQQVGALTHHVAGLERILTGVGIDPPTLRGPTSIVVQRRPSNRTDEPRSADDE